MPQKHKITAEEKGKLVRAYLSGEITQRHAGEVAMVSPTTIQVWIKPLSLCVEARYTFFIGGYS